jgi:type IV pilus assembly protein PilB
MANRRDPAEDRRLFGDLLIEAGIVSRVGLAAGLEEQRLRGGRLGYALLKLGAVTPAALHLFLKDAGAFLCPDLLRVMRTSPAVDLIPARLAHFYGMVPVQVEGDSLVLAVATADSPALVPAVSALTGLRVDPIVCPPSLIAEVLAGFYRKEVETGVVLNATGEHLFVLSDSRRGIRAMLPETLRGDAPASEWLRAIAAEAIRRSSRTVRLEPMRRAARVTMIGTREGAQILPFPRGAYPGMAALLEELSGLGARRRVVPREGRFVLKADGRRLGVTVAARPGLDGDAYILSMREERVAIPSRQEIEQDLPELPRVAAELAASQRGILLVAGRDPAGRRVGLESVLAILRDRMAGGGTAEVPLEAPSGPLALPDDEEEVSFRARLDRAGDQAPDPLVLPDLEHRGRAASAFALARERVVVAAIAAVDAFAAVETIARQGLATEPGLPAGILGVRLMDGLCLSCRRPYDLHDVVPPGPLHRRVAPGPYHSALGCALCRGPDAPAREAVFEFLTASRLFRSRTHDAQALREESVREGMQTLFEAGLLKASRGSVDVKEPLRFLLHEQS